jgi:D-lactate dehydrogenase
MEDMMKRMRIVFFDAKPYDINSFKDININYNFEIKYLESKLTLDTVSLTKGYEAVCVFVNDTLNKEVIDR